MTATVPAAGQRDEVGRRLASGRWAIAGTPVDAAYPCRCDPGRECAPGWCECAGRLDQVPAGCCARRHTPEVAAAAHAERDRRRRR